MMRTTDNKLFSYDEVHEPNKGVTQITMRHGKRESQKSGSQKDERMGITIIMRENGFDIIPLDKTMTYRNYDGSVTVRSAKLQGET